MAVAALYINSLLGSNRMINDQTWIFLLIIKGVKVKQTTQQKRTRDDVDNADGLLTWTRKLRVIGKTGDGLVACGHLLLDVLIM